MEGDICRVCRCEAQSDRPLFHPCICTGSIKWIHQDCLMQWMRYSRKEYCELCGHRFSFTPIYSPDMPRVLPLKYVAGGLLSSIGTAVNYWVHYSMVAIAWLGVVPLTAYRTYRFLFSGSIDMLLTLPIDMFSTENIAIDVFRGCFVATCTLFTFVGLVWLREQIIHGGGPDWLERDDPPPVVQPDPNEERPIPENNGPEANDGNNNNNNDDNNNEEEHNNNNNNNFVDNNLVNLQNQDRPQEPPVAPPVVPLLGARVPAAAAPGAAPAPAAPRQLPEAPAPDHVPIDPAEPPPPVAPLDAEAEPEAVNEPAEGAADEANWNPMEWERAAEELTWERLLGLDGSMVFLEHVFWVVSLNTLFIFIFAFCPYSIGNFLISFLGIITPGKPLLHFHGLLTTLLGYCVIGITLIKLHAIARFLRWRRQRRILGMCYIVVKVSLLSVVEIGVLPLVCGWWLDICSLPMFDATLKDRKASFKAAPGTSLFIHWMFGMVYVYYFASFIVLLREVLRPGVLWFLRNLNDPDFSPIQEMIHLSILRHARRLIASAIIFGSAVLLMLWAPIQILKSGWPTFLPYTLSGDSEVNELSLQLLLLQIILPGFFEQSHTRIWLKGLVRIWCNVVARILGIKSYLLGTEPRPNDDEVPPRQQPDLGAGLAAAHQAIMQRDVPVGFQPYDRPPFFAVRLVGLLVLMCISLVIGSLTTLTVPVWIGRHGMALWSMGSQITPPPNAVATGTETPPRPHELYTAAMGTYLCWIFSRGIAVAVNLFPQGRAVVMERVKHWISVGTSYALAAIIFVLMLGVIPLMFGLLLELVVVVPLRVPIVQTPVLFLWQDWALGVLYTKIACALTLMGPDWALKRAIEQAYRDGLRDMNLRFIIRELGAPVITCFGLALAVPYVIAHSIMPIFFTNQVTRILIARQIYPFFLLIACIVAIVILQIRQFKKLYVAIKNDKYLVGQRLVNYDHQRKKAAQQAAAAIAQQQAARAQQATQQQLQQGQQQPAQNDQPDEGDVRDRPDPGAAAVAAAQAVQ
ncbi:E3 ubiquitin-protein ligase MARCH6 [Aedes aegypti]|uniref:E3 ubiquitin-protein ligase MARCHF6 n=1 Tax=Aedes aegypti TaxID=7159 RepID=A0A6I8TQ64_AEDAE|nr:E3 ubiquitin-protein ligase MARCH6 [Aedes aegypti]XP_021696397.1 E3 ubiquitin-protein ligase MARCH6 [Aedes aegypti]XP_021696398.1 E3 ubiquitin-protein ligase MARCH6 [Aedes aegypti]XP_021696399.1 E3 ubiquitin-protein ligase MARCH6 [Aedes aegypti]XP_021696400.1 E3 ubiquitin-protein ligase MARCH6 [Aedes aegypti]XP_021696401.1 E3 ubiquitin-protein ligase MARCH6 [Aedes aegypti]XP_021696402.1 E3 ubiquitin-protein ligase MARCH6 [Aedes aegypti]XP_021696403.1 E3 ubiquitin-protein ligase MARCH6 [Ae